MGNVPLASSELQKVIGTCKGTAAASEAVLALNQIRSHNGQGAAGGGGLEGVSCQQSGASVRDSSRQPK